MEWIQSIWNAENGSPVQLITITICLVVLLMLITWIFRKIAGTAAKRNARNRIPRLSVTDWTSVGEKHQLVLVRRDNVEHLLLIGGNSDVVVENNIVRVQSAAKPRADMAPAPKAEASPEQKPEKVEEEKTTDVVTPAVATAAAAATAAVASEAEIPEPVSTVEAVTPTAANVEAEVVDAAAQVTDEIAAEVAEVEIDTPEAEAVTPEAPVTETVEFESDLIASISETLDDEVAAEEPQPAVETPEAAPEPAVTAETNVTESGEDEMQRLLDELASETKDTVGTKEPA